ncbi:HEAT repeat domain-containing protein [Phenylobacterium sp.]|uniref:HEAT repeat domain-containing protein n=1 Tax=Phenylobacterium sp. TaxID=1871053 RepID=UPI002DF270EA|nr:HEAT repeat domain-containing protein [Phenylobacterium sp.]
MRAVTVVWIAALVLASAAVFWMSVLIVLRLFSQRRAARRAAARMAVDAAFVDILQGREDSRRILAPYRTDALLMAESLLSLVAMVRGDDLDVVVHALCRAGVDRVLRDCAISGIGPSRLASVEALGALPGSATRAVLLQAARRGGGRVRLAALRSLLQAGGAVPVARVLGHIERKQLLLSAGLAELLQLVVAADPPGAIAAMGRKDLAPRTRILLIEALSAIHSPEAVAALIGETESPRAEVRAAAVVALGKTMPPGFAPLLPKALRDPDWRVRCAGAQANADEQTAGFVNGLILLLMDHVWLVRFTAEASLSRLGIETQHGPAAVLLGAPAAGRPARTARA